jgi:hypothetical protein
MLLDGLAAVSLLLLAIRLSKYQIACCLCMDISSESAVQFSLSCAADGFLDGGQQAGRQDRRSPEKTRRKKMENCEKRTKSKKKKDKK